MVSLKDVSSGENVRTSGSTGEAAVLSMGSGWDIHPEGNLKKETIGNKAKSFQRYQRAVLCAWEVELAVAQAFLSTQTTVLPPSRSFPLIKGKGKWKWGWN